jgi:hypothetical protein
MIEWVIWRHYLTDLKNWRQFYIRRQRGVGKGKVVGTLYVLSQRLRCCCVIYIYITHLEQHLQLQVLLWWWCYSETRPKSSRISMRSIVRERVLRTPTPPRTPYSALLLRTVRWGVDSSRRRRVRKIVLY